MPSSVAFVRQLGAESGVQLNPLRDGSNIPAFGNADQAFGIIMRATRGRIDKPFLVDRGNVLRKLGKGEPMRVSALNEAWVHVVEALNKGTYQAIVQRIVPAAAVVKYAVATYVSGGGATLTATVSGGEITAVSVDAGGAGYGAGTTITLTGGGGSGAILTPTIVSGSITAVAITSAGTGYSTAPTLAVVPNASPAATFTVSSTAPVAPYLLSLKHLECFNDGFKVEFRAEEKKVSGVLVNNDRITLRVRDVDGSMLYEFTGSLDPNAKDDFGNSAYLPDVVASQTDAMELTVGVSGAQAAIDTDSDAYGYDNNGFQKWAKSGVLVCFDEGGTSYTTTDYAAARSKLQFTELEYGYIASGGSESPALLAQLAQLAFDTNRQFRYDVPGRLTPDEAITFVETLGFGSSQTAHLIHAYWAPLRTDDPTGVNPKGYFGTSTLNIGYACLRNAQKNAKGFAPKNYPIAGKEWPVQRTGVSQSYFPRDQELNALALAKINPVMYETYTGGGRYVFRDSLTQALVDSSLKKLISVAEMSTSIDDFVTRAAKDNLQLPMDVAVNRTRDYLTGLFEAAEASKWLVPSNAPEMNGKAWVFEVKPNEQRPYDAMDVSYWLRYDGTNRQTFVTQTLTR